jgi:gamma-glutamyl hydrolase
VFRNGIEYISTIEAKNYPFFGTQWHPEKPPYEYSMQEIPHSHSAISVSEPVINPV